MIYSCKECGQPVASRTAHAVCWACVTTQQDPKVREALKRLGARLHDADVVTFPQST